MSDTLPEREDQTMEEKANESEIRRIRRARLGKAGIQFDKTLNEFQEKYDIDATTDYCDECKGRPHAPWCSEYKEPNRIVPREYDECTFVHHNGMRCGGFRKDHAKNYREHEFTEQEPIPYLAGRELLKEEIRNQLPPPQGEILTTGPASERQPVARGGGEEWRVVKTIPERPTSDIELMPGNKDGMYFEALRLPWHRQKLLEVIVRYANGYPRAARALNDYKRQHQALVAERERLLETLRELTSAIVECFEEGRLTTRARLAASKGVVVLNEQRSTPQ